MFDWRRSQFCGLAAGAYSIGRLSSLQPRTGSLLPFGSMMGTKSVVRLTHITDPHLYGGESELLRGIATLPSLEATLASAQQRDWPPDAVLATGDLVQDDSAGYAHFRRLLGALGVPVLCVPGNHDDPEAMRRALDCAPFVIGGAVDLGLWRIVLLDSTIPGSAAGRLSAGSLSALE